MLGNGVIHRTTQSSARNQTAAGICVDNPDGNASNRETASFLTIGEHSLVLAVALSIAELLRLDMSCRRRSDPKSWLYASRPGAAIQRTRNSYRGLTDLVQRPPHGRRYGREHEPEKSAGRRRSPGYGFATAPNSKIVLRGKGSRVVLKECQ